MSVSDKTGAAANAELSANLAYQDEILQGVSRTFALTIPQLPERLRNVVGNAYLLCRTADTIEDSDTLSVAQKRKYCDWFAAVVEGGESGEAFGKELAPLLQGCTLEAERDLAANTGRVIRITRSFTDPEQAALKRCVRIMAEGMEDFQEGLFTDGLRDQEHLDAYCYHVAGVVGEMLTSLFCAYSPEIAKRQDELEKRAVSFGKGLQMVNILKDIWDDKERNVCWLPRKTFGDLGFDLSNLEAGPDDPAFQEGLGQLIAITHGHLKNALDYTLLMPKNERGIRDFCLWALGMAVLTLRKMNKRRNFTSGKQVKITRKSVYATIMATRIFGGSNFMLRLLFRIISAGLPKTGSGTME